MANSINVLTCIEIKKNLFQLTLHQNQLVISNSILFVI